MAQKLISKNKFKVLIERDEDGLFTASVPQLPGCHTQAKTLTELQGRIKDAIRLCLSIAGKDAQYRKRIENFSYEPSFVGMEVIAI